MDKPATSRMNTLPATLSGRCSNGWERDQGSRVHAVPYSAGLERGDYTIGKALCGAKPGPRSAGWTCRTDMAVSCPRCLKKMQAT